MSIFKVQPLYFPADYTFRQTGVDVQPRHLLAVNCWAIVVVKKTVTKMIWKCVTTLLLLL